ncbi:hypothetical protein NL676_039179 [Syzygium grande]|nr:hypothetical protein NL676_039179 [Syzygium grande]
MKMILSKGFAHWRGCFRKPLIFYPLVGWFVEEGLFIDQNDQGVEFVHAKVNGQLNQLLEGDCNEDLLGRLFEFPRD